MDATSIKDTKLFRKILHNKQPEFRRFFRNQFGLSVNHVSVGENVEGVNAPVSTLANHSSL